MGVSVIIPTYNGQKYLAATLQSVQAQTYADWELVIVDDGSKDETAALCKEFAGKDSRIRFSQQANGGIAAARNRGIAEANPAFTLLAFLDHDDLWEPETLAMQLKSIELFPECLGAQGQVRVIDSEGLPLYDEGIEHWFTERRGVKSGRIVDWEPKTPTSLEVLALRSQIMTVGQVVLKKSALENREWFDPAMVPADDYDFWLRLLLRGSLAYTPQPVVAWRKHAANTSGNTQRMIQQDHQVREKVINLPEITPEQKQILREGATKHHLELASLRLGWAKLALGQGKPVAAGKHLRHAFLSYRQGSTKV